MDDNTISQTPSDGENPSKLPETAAEATEAFNANLQDELDRYKKEMEALQAEFNTATDETSPLATKNALIASAPAAIERIIILVAHAESESVQLSAAKYILDVALGKSKLEAATDDFDNLIKQLMADKQEEDAKKKEAAKKKS